MSTQVGRRKDQIYLDPSWVIVPIWKPQTMYIASIITTQANRFVGWPLSIPLKCEQHRTGSVVNTIVGGSMAKPYWSTLKYPYYKKNAGLDAQVRVFQTIVKANGKTLEEYIINVFNYTLREMTLDLCHNYMLEFLECIFKKLT